MEWFDGGGERGAGGGVRASERRQRERQTMRERLALLWLKQAAVL